MKRLFSLQSSLELVAVLIAAGAFTQVVWQFAVGRHFVIPTAFLFLCVVFGNFARYGLRGALWAKHILFWLGFIFSCYLFFAIFWAERFRAWFGNAFVPMFIVLFLLMVFLTWQYRKKNELAL